MSATTLKINLKRIEENYKYFVEASQNLHLQKLLGLLKRMLMDLAVNLLQWLFQKLDVKLFL